MMIVSQFRQLNLSVVNVRTYLFAVLFVGGNMLEYRAKKKGQEQAAS